MNTLSSLLQFIGFSAVAPVGKIEMFAGTTVPAGWALCDGSAIPRGTYGKLFAAIGTTYGAGDGSTTFNLPDMRGRVPMGANSSYPLGSKGGSKDAVVVTHTHTTADDGGGGKTNTTGAHSHTIGYANADRASGGANTRYPVYGSGVSTSSNGDHYHTIPNHHHSVNAPTNAVSGTGKNLQPYVALNYIIFTGYIPTTP